MKNNLYENLKFKFFRNGIAPSEYILCNQPDLLYCFIGLYSERCQLPYPIYFSSYFNRATTITFF